MDKDERVTRFLLKQEIQDFLYHEADLLDERRYEDWLALVAEDVRYWMPMRRNVKVDDLEREYTREGRDISWFDEGKDTLTRRVRQIQTGIHWAEEPVSRISHMVSNVHLLEVNPSVAEPAEVAVKCRFLIYRNRVETETDILVGKREDRLRRVDGQWKIARRKIVLDQNVLLSKNLTFSSSQEDADGGGTDFRLPKRASRYRDGSARDNTPACWRWPADCRSRWATMWSARLASQAHRARTTSARRRASTRSPIN